MFNRDMSFFVKKITKVWLFVWCFSFTLQTQAVSFTADAIQVRGDETTQSKMYWFNGKVRFDYVEDGVSMSKILDDKKNKIIWLDNDNKFYLQRKMQKNEKIFSKKIKKHNPCLNFVGAECLLLKKTVIKGRKAEKWLITIKQHHQEKHVFQWIDKKYKSILKQVNFDGSSLDVTIAENQELNHRQVRKLTMTAYSASGEKRKGIQWYDDELDILIKQQQPNKIIDELRNIKLGKLNKELFVIPKAYMPFKTKASLKNKKATSVKK